MLVFALDPLGLGFGLGLPMWAFSAWGHGGVWHCEILAASPQRRTIHLPIFWKFYLNFSMFSPPSSLLVFFSHPLSWFHLVLNHFHQLDTLQPLYCLPSFVFPFISSSSSSSSTVPLFPAFSPSSLPQRFIFHICLPFFGLPTLLNASWRGALFSFKDLGSFPWLFSFLLILFPPLVLLGVLLLLATTVAVAVVDVTDFLAASKHESIKNRTSQEPFIANFWHRRSMSIAHLFSLLLIVFFSFPVCCFYLRNMHWSDWWLMLRSIRPSEFVFGEAQTVLWPSPLWTWRNYARRLGGSMQHHLIGMHCCLFFRLPALNFQFIPFFGQPRVFFGTAAFSCKLCSFYDNFCICWCSGKKSFRLCSMSCSSWRHLSLCSIKKSYDESVNSLSVTIAWQRLFRWSSFFLLPSSTSKRNSCDSVSFVHWVQC